MHIIKFPIGCWLDDSIVHSMFKTFLATSNKPVEDVREAHFKIFEKTGIDIERISNPTTLHYHEEVLIKLLELGYDFGYPFPGKYIPALKKDVFKIWLFLLNLVDPELELTILDVDSLPSISVDGVDEKGRNLCFLVGCAAV